MPVALKGLSRICHLINIDMAGDIVTIMKSFLDSSVHVAPFHIQVLCIKCALQMLSGPGLELQVDDTVFLTAIQSLLVNMPAAFTDWDVMFDCIELALLKRREVKNNTIVTIVKILLVLCPHMAHPTNGQASITAITLVHHILLRYPRIRTNLIIECNSRMSAGDDVVSDMAMQPLRDSALKDMKDAEELDGNWILPLLGKHIYPQFNRMVTILTARDVIPVPLRLSDAKTFEDESIKIMQEVDRLFDVIPSHLGTKNGRKSMSKNPSSTNPSTATNNNNNTSIINSNASHQNNRDYHRQNNTKENINKNSLIKKKAFSPKKDGDKAMKARKKK